MLSSVAALHLRVMLSFHGRLRRQSILFVLKLLQCGQTSYFCTIKLGHLASFIEKLTQPEVFPSLEKELPKST